MSGRLETQGTISEWADNTFGVASSNKRIAERAQEEMNELFEALEKADDNPQAAEEVADVVIVLCRITRNLGAELLYEVDQKMQINRQRKWKLDGTGHGYHE